MRRAGWADVAGSLGSDPVLAAELVRAHVYGLQGGAAVRPGGGTLAAVVPDVGGTAGQAVRGVDHGWSERTLRTTVLPASESAVRAGAALVLPAAVANDGIPLHADSRLLQQVLRAEWGFTGVVMASADDVLGLAERHHVAETADAALALAIESGVHVVFGPDGPRAPAAPTTWRAGCCACSSRAGWRAGWWTRPWSPSCSSSWPWASSTSPSPSARRCPARRGWRSRPGPRPSRRCCSPTRARCSPSPGRARSSWSRAARRSRRAGWSTRWPGRHPGGARAVDPAEVGWRPAAAVVVVVDDPEGAEVAIGRLVATGTPCVALVGGADPRVLAPLVATTAAVVLCWQPVHVHADAHADVLLGAAEPGGRLPVPITGDGGRVVFPLGHGAGYTSVEYSHLRIAPGPRRRGRRSWSSSAG